MQASSLFRVVVGILTALFIYPLASCNQAANEGVSGGADTIRQSPKPDSVSAGSRSQAVDENLYVLYVDVAKIKTAGNKVMFSFFVNPHGELTLKGWELPLKTDTSKPANSVVLDLTIGDPSGIYLDRDLHLSSLFTVNVKKIVNSLKPTTQYIVFYPRISTMVSGGRVLVYDLYMSDVQPLTNLAKGDPLNITLNPSPPYGSQ